MEADVFMAVRELCQILSTKCEAPITPEQAKPPVFIDQRRGLFPAL